MELELKHLAAYLPYNVRVKHDFNCVNILGSVTPLAIHTEQGHTLNYSAFLEFKLILKPMSQLTRKELEDEGIGVSVVNSVIYQIDKPKLLKTLYYEAPYHLVQYFLSQHYDIFGLIELGLAVEK